MVLVKHDSSGNLLWIKQLGTASNEYENNIDIDGSDNIYLVGRTDGDLDGPGPGTNAGGYDAYIVKYDSIGNLQWIRQYGAGLNDDAGGVDTDSAGNVLMTGDTSGDLDGAGPGTHAGYEDVFLIRLYPDGTVHYITQSGSDAREVARDVRVDSSGNIYIGGYTTGGFFGVDNGSWDMFIYKSADVCP
jgi:hypothetical protein